VIPKDTILIQNPAAVVGQGSGAAEAQKFVNYLVSPAGQAIWGLQGLPPGDLRRSRGQLPTPAGQFTIDSLGGWKTVTKQFFEPETGIVTKIEQSLGVSTAK